MENLEVMKNLVETQLKFYNERNLESFCACFHPEIEIITLGNTEKIVGLELFKTLYSNLFQKSEELHCEIRSRVFLSGSVVDEEYITGAFNYPVGLHAVVIYRFRDNLISNICIAK